MKEFFLIYFLLAAQGLSMIICFVLIGGFMLFLKRARPEFRFQKLFAFFPVVIKGKTVWLKFYYRYQEYGAGVVLGGTLKTHYTEDGKVWWSGSGSFFPSYKTLWTGERKFAYREFLRQEGWRSVKQQKIDEVKRVEGLRNFFGEEFYEKHLKNCKGWSVK